MMSSGQQSLDESGQNRSDAPSDTQYRDPDWLREQYVEYERSSIDIAETCGCDESTVRRWLDKHGIETRSPSPTPDERLDNGDWLQEQYVERERSIIDIAEECGCSNNTVLRRLERHGIETRSLSEANTGTMHPKWAGGEVPYGPGWTETKRQAVRERDEHQCQDCGLTQSAHQRKHDCALHVHHLLKARDVEDPAERNAMSNLITLCHSCHQRWERLAAANIRPQIPGVTTSKDVTDDE
jgi:5-methylcytosine-specific restriction endonuclease McrA